MQIETLHNNLIFSFISIFLYLIIFITIFWFILTKILNVIEINKSEYNYINILKNVKFKHILLLSTFLSLLVSLFNTANQPKVKIEPTIIQDGYQLQRKQIISENGKFIDSPTKKELEEDTKNDEAESDKKLKELGIDLLHK